MFGYISKLLSAVPMLSALVEKQGAESIDLRNGIVIEIHTANFRGVRGYSIVGAVLLGISSPYSRHGMLWEMYRSHLGVDDSEALVVQADTRAMNPLVPEDVIARAYQDDEAVASAEYGAVFRRDLEAFISPEVVEAAVVPGRRELAPRLGDSYVAFYDPSGGSRGDSFTVAVAHREGDRHVLDPLRERKPPLSPDSVIKEFAPFLKGFGIDTVVGD